MRRRCFSLLALVSLLLFVAVCALWVRSYFVSDQVAWRLTNGVRSLQDGKGSIWLVTASFDAAWMPADWYGWTYQNDRASGPVNFLRLLNWDPGDVSVEHEWAGFAWHEKRGTLQRNRTVMIVAPLWSLALATAVLPVVWMAGRMRSRWRRRAGCCANCGYDLRATPEGGGALLERCPECGAVGEKMNVEHRTSNVQHRSEDSGADASRSTLDVRR